MTARKKIFLSLFLVLQLGFIWPLYPLFSGIKPMILGLPLSFAWVILMLLGCFFLVLWYYLSDPDVNTNHPKED